MFPGDGTAQRTGGKSRVCQKGGHEILLHGGCGAQEHRMEQDAEKFAFPPVFGKAVVELTGIDEEPLPRMDRGHLAVDIVIHLPGEHSDELHIIVPVA